MVQLPIFLSLAIGGIAGALWREYKQVKAYQGQLALPSPGSNTQPRLKLFPEVAVRPFDDVAELTHYQRVSRYSLAFSLSGLWFYSPATLVSIPLLSYSTYYLVKTIRQSTAADQKSPMTAFQTIGVAGTLLSRHLITASVLFLFSFGMRKLQVQGGNLVNIDLARTFNPQHAKVWVLRNGAEIEVLVDELQRSDTVVLHSGDTIITEGTVIEGSGTIRQYSLQKRMKSISKQSGDKVFPFTYLASGCLYIQPS